MTQIKGRYQYEYIGVYRNVILSVSYRTCLAMWAGLLWLRAGTRRKTEIWNILHSKQLYGCHAITGLLFLDVSKALHKFETWGSSNSATQPWAFYITAVKTSNLAPNGASRTLVRGVSRNVTSRRIEPPAGTWRVSTLPLTTNSEFSVKSHYPCQLSINLVAQYGIDSLGWECGPAADCCKLRR